MQISDRGYNDPYPTQSQGNDTARGSSAVAPVAANYGPALPVVYGTARVPGSVVYMDVAYEAQVRVPSTEIGAAHDAYKELAGAAANTVIAICEAPVTKVLTIWRDKDRLDTATRLSWLTPQGGAYSILTSETPRPTQGDFLATAFGLCFTGTAIFVANKLALPNSSVPNLSFEVQGACVSIGNNAHPADVLVDLFTSTRHGLGLPAANVEVDVGPDGLVASSYRAWCTAAGFTVSRAITDRGDAASIIESLLADTHATAVWSNGKFKVIPLGGAVGAYVPPTAAVRLDADEILNDGSGDPVQVTRSPEEDVFNCLPVSVKLATSDYREVLFEYKDAVNVAAKGMKRADTYKSEWLTSPNQAVRLAQLKVQRSIYVRNAYRFKVSRRWDLLEPGDLISLTEASLGIVDQVCRITGISEAGDDALEIEAEEWNVAAAATVDLTPQSDDGFASVTLPTTYPAAQAENAQTTADAAANTAAQAQQTANSALTAANGAVSIADGKNRSYFQATAPTGTFVTGDLWFDTANGNKVSRWSGSAWVSVQDAGIAAAQSTANTALTSANGKNKTYYQGTTPTGSFVDGDLWFDTANGNKPYRYAGTGWVLVHDSTPVVSAEIAAGAVIAGKIAADAVTAGNVAASAITARELAADSVIASKIKAGEVQAGHIAAGSITTSALTVGGGLDNLWPNGNSEKAPPAGWVDPLKHGPFNARDPEFARIETWTGGFAYGGTNRLRHLVGQWDGIELWVPAREGESFYAEAQGRCWAPWGMDMGIYFCSGAATPAAIANYATTGGTPGCTPFVIDAAWHKGTVTTGKAPAGTAWARIWIQQTVAGGDCFVDDIYVRKMTDKTGIVADAIRTTNYAENGSGVPTAGAKMDMAGTALKVVSGGFQLGTYTFTDYFFRIFQGIDGANAGTIIWRGNNDTGTRGGAPNILALNIWNRYGTPVQSPYLGTLAWYAVGIYPSGANTDNLDGLTSMEVNFYSSAGNWLSQGLYALPMSRCYNGTSNINGTTVSIGIPGGQYIYGTSPYMPQMYLRARLQNAYGWSDQCDFTPNNVFNTMLTRSSPGVSAIPGQGAPAAGGGGGSSGGGCPAPWVKVQLASGLLVDAGDLYDGAQVVAVQDNGQFTPTVGTVRDPSTIWRERYAVVLEDGRAPEFSKDHRVATADKEWVAVQNLKPGTLLLAQRESRVKQIVPKGMGQVVTFRVEGAGTYFSDDILSHNAKILNG